MISPNSTTNWPSLGGGVPQNCLLWFSRSKPPAVQSGSVVKLWFLQRYSPRHLQVISNLWCWNIFLWMAPPKKDPSTPGSFRKKLTLFFVFPYRDFHESSSISIFSPRNVPLHYYFVSKRSPVAHVPTKASIFWHLVLLHPCSDILRTGEKLEIDRGRNPPVWIWKGVFQTLGSLGEALNLLMWFSICFQALQRRLDPFHPIYFIQVVDLRWFQYRILMHTTNENMFF